MNKSKLEDCSNIIWDWNGTLLNDLDVCVVSINRLLSKRGLSLLNNQKYLDIFTFPVKDYYMEAGFDFADETFETVAVEFMDHYLHLVRSAGLHHAVIETLSYFKNTGREQIILSAMEQTELVKLVNEHRIEGFFGGIFGIKDHLAHGKLGIANLAMKNAGFEKRATCLIGDTLHDAEVAAELGINCLLVANGHQSKTRLKASGYPVISSVREVGKVFGKR